MDDFELLLYSRHLLLEDFGIPAQERLSSKSALVVGVGGLGCSAALYLVTAGIGRITLVDHDTVELSNLQRQILYRSDHIGHPKVQSAQRALAPMNPCVQIDIWPQRLSQENLPPNFRQTDIVLDCSDNFSTRYTLNLLCIQEGIPLVLGAAIQFEGQVAVFDARQPDSPCYACLFPDRLAIPTRHAPLLSSAASRDAEACSTMGVFSPLTGIIGTLQAAEAIKLLGGIGPPLIGQLLLFDALRTFWRRTTILRDPSCPACNTRALSNSTDDSCSQPFPKS